jgi:energy-converting hydrogenase A subunit M
VIGMDDNEKLRLMQTRIIKSYAWQRDIIVPLSNDFDCTTDELEEVFFDLLDLDSLEALHGTFESAQDICLYQKLNADLRLCWLIDTLELLPRESGRNLKMKLVKEIKNGKSYEDAVKEGKVELFQLLKKEAEN